MLQDYGLAQYHEEAKDWYDGYLFGKKYVYCPWSIIKYVNDKISDKDSKPDNYWANSSGNDIIIKFLNRTDFSEVPSKFEKLVNGGSITQKIHNDLPDLQGIAVYVCMSDIYISVYSQLLT